MIWTLLAISCFFMLSHATVKRCTIGPQAAGWILRDRLSPFLAKYLSVCSKMNDITPNIAANVKTSHQGSEKAAVDDCTQDKEVQDAVVFQRPYTVFTKGQKRFISLTASFAAMFSTLMSYIYYPALVPMSRSLGVSVSLINLTVTSYLIVAAIAPAFMGDMADQAGRRPIYILMFTLLIAANIGIALQNSYAALFVLRMLQSAGSSGLTSVAYGVIADITVAGERGGFVGGMLVA